jgi:hypothetical protein
LGKLISSYKFQIVPKIDLVETDRSLSKESPPKCANPFRIESNLKGFYITGSKTNEDAVVVRPAGKVNLFQLWCWDSSKKAIKSYVNGYVIDVAGS